MVILAQLASPASAQDLTHTYIALVPDMCPAVLIKFAHAHIADVSINQSYTYHTVKLQWLEHLWNHENMFETGLVRANEC